MILFYGDNIADKPTTEVGPDKWRSEMDMAKEIRGSGEPPRRRCHAGPSAGYRDQGEYHFLMSDLNNQQVAEQMEKWLEQKGLAR